MKYFIGGLFRNREAAEEAHKALHEAGLDEASISMLQCTHEKKAVVLKENTSIKSIGQGALTGVIILGGAGALLGLLVGWGVIHFPSLEPSTGQALPFQITWQFTLAAVVTGLLFGALTGAILGAAARMAMSPYKRVNTAQEVNKGDLMLAVQANDKRKESQARSILQEHGAVRLEEFQENWDPEVWSLMNERAPQIRS